MSAAMDAEIVAMAADAILKLRQEVEAAKEMNKQVDHIVEDLRNATSTSAWAVVLLDEIIDELVHGLVLETHRSVHLQNDRNKALGLEPAIRDIRGMYAGLDIYGQKQEKNAADWVRCKNCNQSVNSSRFAPHLEKCMGMGRNASRQARRQIETKNVSPMSSGSDEFDDTEDTADETYGAKSLRKARRAASHSPKKPKMRKADAYKKSTFFETGGTREELGTFFAQYCGVEAATTGRLCTKSVRCPQHNAEQRRLIRLSMTPGSIDPNTLMSKRGNGLALPDSAIAGGANYFGGMLNSDMDGDSTYGGISDQSSIVNSAPPSPSSTKSGSPDMTRSKKRKKKSNLS